MGVSDAGLRLGLIPKGQSQVDSTLDGSFQAVIGEDFYPRDAGGTLDTLLRLETAVREGDLPEIERLQVRLDEDLDRASRVRGQVGVWSRNLDELRDATEETSIQLQDQLSEELDADIAKVLSDITQRQIAMEASMRVIGQTSQLTVLNYL